jgi:hypothetical protein
LYLATVVGLAIHCGVVWKADVDIWLPPCQYQGIIDLLASSSTPGLKVYAQWALKLVMKSSTNIYQYLSEDISGGLSDS